MSKLTLDLNGLNVESFSPEDPMGSPRISDVMTCIPNAGTPMSLTNPPCCMGVEACTVKEPCCGVVTP